MSVVPNLPLPRLVSLLLVLTLLLPALILAQGKYPHRDSLRVSRDSAATSRRDSLGVVLADSLAGRVDSVFRPIFPPAAGSFDRPAVRGAVITADSMEWFGARYAGEILAWIPGMFPVEQSSEGQYSQPSVRGTDWRSISVASDGRSMIDPATSLYNYYYADPVYYDQVEIVTGPRSFLYGLQGAGAAVNLVTKNISSNRPFTHLVYSEGPEGYGLFDGVYSQNVSRRFNATVGVHREGTDGVYLNSVDEGWNVRAKFRYHVTRTLTAIVSEYFTSTRTDLNGGINYAKTGFDGSFNTRTATLMNTDSYEKVRRHDLDAMLIGTFFGDSVNISKLSLFYSNSLREYRDEENRTIPNGILIRSDHRSSWLGGQFTQHLTLGPAGFSFGAEVLNRQIEGSPNLGRRQEATVSAWAKMDLTPVGDLDLSLFGRTERFSGVSYFGLGGDASWNVVRWLNLFGGVSVSDRPPNFFELYWTDSTLARGTVPVSERHVRVEAGGEIRAGEVLNLRGTVFYRNVTDPILFSPYEPGRYVFPGAAISQGGSEKMYGAEGWMALRIVPILFELSGTFLFHAEDSGSRLDRYPRIYGRAGVFYRNRLFADHLDLKVGAEGRFNSSFRGDLYNPEMTVFVRNGGSVVTGSASLDLLLIAHIGDAYVHFIWENPLSITYFSEPYYAGLPSGIRFGISWVFFN
jgi:outer membrane cobalamin receptor